MAIETAIGAGALLFVLWIAWAVAVFVRGQPWIVNLEDRCHGAETQCGVFLGFGSSLLTVALVTAVFVVWRLWRAKQPIARRARTNAREFVPTEPPRDSWRLQPLRGWSHADKGQAVPAGDP
jgi:hypothetical protein